MLTPFLQVVDRFYPQPGLIRRRALALKYSEPEELVGWRTRAYQAPAIKSLIERKFRIRIGYWERDLTAIEACNGVFFSAFGHGPRAEKVGIHFDEPPAWAMLLIYLTPAAPLDAGTSIWKHRSSGLTQSPTRRDAQRLGIELPDLNAILERDGRRRDRWLEIDRIGNVYNRAVIFPGGLFHSATRHFGSNQINGRLYQSFHFPIRKR